MEIILAVTQHLGAGGRGSAEDSLWLHNETEDSWEHTGHCLKLTMNENLKQKNSKLKSRMSIDLRRELGNILEDILLNFAVIWNV